MICRSDLIRLAVLCPKALGFRIGRETPDEIFNQSDLKNLNFHIKDLLVFSLSILYHKK